MKSGAHQLIGWLFSWFIRMFDVSSPVDCIYHTYHSAHQLIGWVKIPHSEGDQHIAGQRRTGMVSKEMKMRI